MTAGDHDHGDEPRTLHDGFFKHLFSDPARAADELCAVLPPALVVIVPVVVYHGTRPWRAPTDMHALYALPDELTAALGTKALSCSFVLDDLYAAEDAALRARGMDVYARLCLFAMARAAAEDALRARPRVAACGASVRACDGA